ncbi:MAG: fluoride efflux transporter CrcB [bacterium]
MVKLLYVGLGGFLGSVSRYLLSGFIHKLFDKSLFPIGTLTVNVIGCFLIGFLNGIGDSRQVFTPEFRLFVFIGVLGGFTTFSTFGYEVFTFAHDAQFFSSLLNIALHLILGLGAVWLGYSFSKFI